MHAGVNETSLAQVNKGIRKELERLTKEAQVLSAIHGVLLQFMSDDQRDQIKSEVRKIICAQFTQEELNSYYKRNSGRLRCTVLESYVLEIVKPKETR